MSPVIAFLFVAGFGNLGAPGSYFITVPGVASENACHQLAIKLNAPKHGCFSYEMATPHLDMADAVQDELQDNGVIR
jgi:hypothetical protein